MRVTVAVCTWNRASTLRGALGALASVRRPTGLEWTVLVVDNGSTDGTSGVVSSFSDVLPVVCVTEPRRGLASARNRAVREAEGEYVLWIDDDVLVDSGWLAAYAEAFRQWPQDAVFGGPIIPELEGRPPSWLRACLPRVGFAYAALDLGPEPVPLGPSGDHVPFGGNMAVRTDVLRLHPFPEDRGRRGNDRSRGGEETVVLRSILAGGGGGRWVPGARVRHRIPSERQTVAYVRLYGAADAFAEEMTRVERGDPPPDGRKLFATLRLLARLVFADVRYRAFRIAGARPEVWIEDLLASADAAGRLRARSSSGRNS